MSREDEVKALLVADATLMAMLTGGIYTEQEVGVEGIRRGPNSPTAAAYDDEHALLPCALIRQGGIVPYGNVRSYADKFSAVSQTVTIYFYERRGLDVVVPAARRVFDILEGSRIGRSYPAWMLIESPPLPDDGPMLNSTVVSQDWLIVSTRQVAEIA